jgi:hypothetical protein
MQGKVLEEAHIFGLSVQTQTNQKERQEVCIVRKPNLLFTTKLVSHFYHNTSTHYRLHTLPEAPCSTQVIMGQVDSNEPRIENKESNKTISLQI